MFNLKLIARFGKGGISFSSPQKLCVRHFLSQAYYCRQVWENRLNSKILQKVNLDDLYYNLDQRFQKTRQMSAVDVDIFANAINSSEFTDELLDLVHKLRLTADTGNTLNSTSHAVIRALLQCNRKNDLLQVLDDRINYGIFLDYYTANFLFDVFWKEKDFTSGARVASQLMLQEEFDHPVSVNFSLLHCYNYLISPGEWPVPVPPEEPEEEVKIRVKYLRNPYDDDHFDLREPKKVVGKTLAMLTTGNNDSLSKSFNIIGLVLYEKLDKAKEIIKECQDTKIKLYKNILDLIPDENEIKKDISLLETESVDVNNLLKTNIEKAVQITSEKDIFEQCQNISKWEEERNSALAEQIRRLSVAQRLAHIEDLKKDLKERETRLWFFENEEQIELQIESKQMEKSQEIRLKEYGKRGKVVAEDVEVYVPPEIRSSQSTK